MKPASLTADLLARKGEARPAARLDDRCSDHAKVNGQPQQPPQRQPRPGPDYSEVSFMEIHREARKPEWESERKHDYLRTRRPADRFLNPVVGALSKLTVRIEKNLHKELRLVSACSGRTQQDLVNRGIRHVLTEWENEMGCADQCFCRNAAKEEGCHDKDVS